MKKCPRENDSKASAYSARATRHTFWCVIHGFLKIFHHSFLPDHLFNLPLRIGVKRIGIEQGQFFLSSCLDLYLSSLNLVKGFPETGGIRDRIGKRRLGRSDLGQHSRVVQGLLSNNFGIHLRRPALRS